MKTLKQLVLGVSAMALAAGTAAADVRVVHASPDTPAVDVYVNAVPGEGDPAITGLGFTEATGYISLPTGNYDLRVTPAGAASPVAIEALGVAIDQNVDISIIAIDFFDSIRPLVLVDDRQSVAGRSKVRFVHVSPDAGAVDVFAQGVDDALFSGFEFEDASTYLSLDPGTVDLRVELAAGGSALFEGIELRSGFNYTIFAMGSLADGTLDAVILVDAIPSPGGLAMLGLAGLAAARRRR